MLSSKNLLNLSLLLIIGLLLLLIFYPTNNSDNKKKPLISQIQPTELNQITIKILGSEPISFIKDANHWFVVREQQRLSVNKEKLEKIMALIQAPSERHFAATSHDLAKYNLETPTVSVQFNDLRIAFGSIDPFSKKRYLLVDKEIYLITDRYYHLLLSPWSEFVTTD